MSPELKILLIIIFIIPLCIPLSAHLCFKKAQESTDIQSKEFERLMYFGSRGGWMTITWMVMSFGLSAWDSYLLFPSPRDPTGMRFPLMFLSMLWAVSSGYNLFLYEYYYNKLNKNNENKHRDQDQHSDASENTALVFLVLTMFLLLVKRL